MSVSVPFNAEALEANRAGRLTRDQLVNLRRYDRGVGGNNVTVAVFCVILAIVLFMYRAPGENAWVRPYAGVAAVAVAILLVRRRLGLGGRLAADLRAGRVEAVEGAIAKPAIGRIGGNRGADGRRMLEVGGERFMVFRGSYAAAPDAGFVRLYYLPRSRHVVNLEQLPDRPLPQAVLDSPMEALRAFGSALVSRDPRTRAEAAADVAAFGSALGVERGRPVPPTPAEQDGRPLGEAILGRWRNGMVDLTFSADGTVAVRMPGGVERQGRWSVDAVGRLHTDATGASQAADAWIAGDALTISADETTLTFRRA